MQETTLFKSKQLPWFYEVTRILTSSSFNFLYNLDFRNMDRIAGLKEEGFLVLPKHQFMMDIPLEGLYLYNAIGKRAHYIMKHSLPFYLEYLGGIKVFRKLDIRKDALPEERLKLIERVAYEKQRLDAIMAYLVNRGEKVVIHPEAERRYRKSFTPRVDLLERLVKMKTEKDPIFVPMAITYSNGKHFKSRITVDAGVPLQTRCHKELESHLREYIPDEISLGGPGILKA